MTHMNLHKSALLIIDMQNDFCHAEGWASKAGIPDASAPIIPVIDRLAVAAREQGIPVVWVYANYTPALMNEPFAAKAKEFGETFPCATPWGMEIIDKLKVEGDDTKVQKSCYNGFHDTSLASVLRDKGVDTVVVCGVLTSVCVESTARGAFFNGFHVMVAEDAVGDEPNATASTLKCLGAFFGSVRLADTIQREWAGDSSSPGHMS